MKHAQHYDQTQNDKNTARTGSKSSTHTSSVHISIYVSPETPTFEHKLQQKRL
jgi:hypothetical protein